MTDNKSRPAQVIAWKNPPPRRPSSGRNGGKYLAVAAALRENHGQWALIAEGVSSSFTTSVTGGKLVGFAPAGAFEAVSRTRPRDTDGKTRFDVYARYVGGQS